MKKSSIIGMIIIAMAIGVIVSTYADSSTYGSFTDAQETQRELHVVGKLIKNKEMVYNPEVDANYFSFYMIDSKGKECKVEFTGTKPQDFERSEQIVLTGQMNDGNFQANKILMKCPSKYTQDKVEITEVKVQEKS
jgi:cytochrome c-type biogenesis protein CcmE